MLEREFAAKKVVPWLKQMAFFYFKKPQGKFVTRKGIADIQICIRGRYIALELKTDSGRLSKSQETERMRVIAAEGIYIIARPKSWSRIQQLLVTLSRNADKFHTFFTPDVLRYYAELS